jgi:transposase
MHYIGIDIAKAAHEVGILDEGGGQVAPSFSITNTEKGFAKLLAAFSKYGVDAKDCLIGMEATGHYWLSIYSHLVEEGYHAAVVNPIQTDAFRNVGTVRAAKTDAIDAFLIADLMRFGRFSQTHLADESMVALKQLTRHRSGLVKQRTALKNKVAAVIDMVFPEYPTLFSDIYGEGSKALLKAHPTPGELSKVPVKRLAALLSKASKGHLGQSKAAEVKEAAAASFGIPFALDALAFQIKQTVALIDFISGQVEELDGQVAKALEETGTYLDTTPGIGPVFASVIASEIGDIGRFTSAPQIIAYAGMDVPANQSGGFTGSKKHMSKRGSPQLRWALIEGADKVRVWDPYFAEYYGRLIARGKHHHVAIAAVARKLVNVVFTLLKERRPYQPQPPKR